MKRLVAAVRLAMVAVLAAPVGSAAQGVRLRAIATEDAAPGTAGAVVVEEGALVHTALLLPDDPEGRLRGEDDVRLQALRVLENLQTALAAAGTGVDRLVRLHVYLTDGSARPAIERLLAERFTGAHKPAVTFVENGPGPQGRARRDGCDRGGAGADPEISRGPDGTWCRALRGSRATARTSPCSRRDHSPSWPASHPRVSSKPGSPARWSSCAPPSAASGCRSITSCRSRAMSAILGRADQLRDIVAGHFEGHRAAAGGHRMAGHRCARRDRADCRDGRA